MNYWLLTTEYPPFFGGGISTYCYHTVTMFADKGHRISVFINDTTVSSVKIQENNNIRIIRFNPSRTNSSSFLGHVTNISYEFAHIVKQFIEKEGKPDIIEAQEYLGIAYYLLQYKHLLYDWCKDVPIFITMHSPSLLYMEYNHVSQYRYPNYWICEMERFCLQAADHIISPSQYMVNELEKRFCLTNKSITVVPNPYVYNSTITKNINIGTNPEQVIFYGKLTAQKGAFELLRYFSELWDAGFLKPLYLIGGQDIVYHPEGISMGDWIRKKYARYIKKQLLFMEGRIKPSEITNRLSRAEVVVVPSNNDNLPYVVLEMMAIGKIVLVSKQGGQSEIVEHGVDGFVFDHTEPDTFSKELKYILALSAGQRESISAAAVEKIKNKYGYEAIYAGKQSVIKSVLKQKDVFPDHFPFIRSRPKESIVSGKDYILNEGLSIVIPYYNMGKYIDKTISSIKTAAYNEMEIIIVNDGSDDKGSLEKLNAYRQDPTIKIIDSNNQGIASARNLGASRASGKYLAFLDADDMVLPDYYHRAVTILGHYSNVHFVGCWTQYFENSSGVWPSFLPEPPLILFHNLVNSSALVYKRESFLKGGQNDKHMAFQGLEDYEGVISMIEKGFAGVVIPELLFHYRVRRDSMIRDISKAKKNLLYQYISSKHKEFYADFAADIFNLANANGPGMLLDNPSLDLHLADKTPFGTKTSLKLVRIIKKNRHIRTMAYKLYSYTKK